MELYDFYHLNKAKKNSISEKKEVSKVLRDQQPNVDGFEDICADCEPTRKDRNRAALITF